MTAKQIQERKPFSKISRYTFEQQYIENFAEFTIEVKNRLKHFELKMNSSDVFVKSVQADVFVKSVQYLIQDFDEAQEAMLVEIEKEKLYYVKFPSFGNDCYLNLKTTIGEYNLYDKEQDDYHKTKFTEQEIKEIDERYWAFAVLVEEEE